MSSLRRGTGVPRLAVAGLIAGVLGLFVSISFETRTVVNGRVTTCSYFDLFPTLAGAFCLVVAAIMVGRALRSAGEAGRPWQTHPLTLAGVLVGLGALDVLRGVGVVFSPC